MGKKLINVYTPIRTTIRISDIEALALIKVAEIQKTTPKELVNSLYVKAKGPNKTGEIRDYLFITLLKEVNNGN